MVEHQAEIVAFSKGRIIGRDICWEDVLWECLHEMHKAVCVHAVNRTKTTEDAVNVRTNTFISLKNIWLLSIIPDEDRKDVLEWEKLTEELPSQEWTEEEISALFAS